jgi:hypothetical protein
VKRSWVTGVAVAVVLVGVVALGVVREWPQSGEPVSPTSTAAEDSVFPPSLRASLERGGPIDAALTAPSTVPAQGAEPQIPIVKGIGITFRSPFVPLTELQGRLLGESLVRVRRRPEAVWPDCIFQPDIAFRFGASPDSLRIIICHGCGETKVLSTKGTWGSMLGFESDTLLALTAELFPDDDRIADYRSQRAGR